MKEPLAINIVSFNIPYPPDFGGSIDVFYKIKALAEQGVRIHLHCFWYGNQQMDPELGKCCEKIFFYKRKKGPIYFFNKLPYIVATRNSRDLIRNLKNSTAPVFFEGLHSCYWLRHPDLSGRTKIVRMHNIEHHYYHELGKASLNPFRKLYFFTESLKLRNFEKILRYADLVASISPSDYHYLNSRYPKSVLVPAFHPFSRVTSQSGTGSFFLYHGNLSVEENQKAVYFLVEKVFKGLDTQLIVAGKNPSHRMKQLIEKQQNINIIINPTEIEMNTLIAGAQATVLPTFQSTGLKLKLIASLYTGRFCIVNSRMVSGTGLEPLCMIADSPEDFKNYIDKLRFRIFTEEEKEKREKILSEHYSNKSGVKELINCIELSSYEEV